MLILDVSMHWSSTHQMICKSILYIFIWCDLLSNQLPIGRALKYEGEINTFVVLHENQDLCNLKLLEGEWSSIKLISGWLEKFWDATTQMSTTHQPMLSHTHAIFHGLQDHIRNALRNLPSGMDLHIQQGLLASHHKLAEYYYRFDQSPFYIWAVHMSVSFLIMP